MSAPKNQIRIEQVFRVWSGERDLGIFSDTELVKLHGEIADTLGLRTDFAGADVEDLLRVFCLVTGMNRIALRGRTKTEPLLFKRQVAIGLASELCPGTPLEVIGLKFGRKSSLVVHNRTALANRINASEEDRKEFHRLRAACIEMLSGSTKAESKIVSL